MAITTHLKSLQALEMAIRVGSLKDAADKLAITPAAIGQRIRTLEDFLGTDLLVRGRSGLKPTGDLVIALADLRTAFAALERVTQSLDFQRITEIHVVADPDWSYLWLLPRLPQFRAQHPNILFCVNGEGDVPVRIGAPDCRIEYGDPGRGEILFTDILLPLAASDDLHPVADWDNEMTMDGLPLLHTLGQRDDPDQPGWVDWFSEYGLRREGVDRGVHYRNIRLALEAARQYVGFLVCGLSLVQDDLDSGSLVLPFAKEKYIKAPHPYVLTVPSQSPKRPQLQRFCDWLRGEAALTRDKIEAVVREN